MIVRNNPLFSAQQATARIAAVRAKLDRATEVAMAGTDVIRPSDAPGRWQLLHGLSASIRDQTTWLDNGLAARDLYDTADQALGSANELFNRARERAVQFASETHTAESRIAASVEIDKLREDLLSLANTRIAGRALFAGDAYDGLAFDANGAYIGGPATLTTQISDTQAIETTLDGAAVFQGGIDVFQALSDLQAALAANDPAAVVATFGDLEAAQQQLIEARQEIGYLQVRVDDAATVASNLAVLFEGRLTEHTAVDPTESFTDLSQLQTTYQTALQVTAFQSSTKLFDFLR